jgi:hypothetical protein
MKYYILENRKVKSVTESEFSEWYKTRDIVISKTRVGTTGISTVFLIFDHDFTGNGPPILFETMVFGGKLNDFTERYSTFSEAESGHARIVRQVIRAQRSMFRKFLDWLMRK